MLVLITTESESPPMVFLRSHTHQEQIQSRIGAQREKELGFKNSHPMVLLMETWAESKSLPGVKEITSPDAI